MSIHHAASKGFGASASPYERARPTYPADAVGFLDDALGLAPGVVVADVGAGTGKLTRLVVPTGAAVLAVEPVTAMREQLRAAVPSAMVLAATAERLPLARASLDAVVAAQAFHWFDPVEAVAELARVVRPGGRVGLIWNVRDEQVPWVRRLTELLEPHEHGRPAYRHGAWRAGFDGTPAFSPLEHRAFRLDQELTPAQLAERVSSMSFVAALDEPIRRAVLDEVRSLGEAQGERLVLPHRTDVFWCTRS